MKTDEILEKLQSEIENAPNVPLTNKVMIDSEEILDLIEQLRGAIPADIQEAKKIKDHENRITQRANTEARSILEHANETKARLIDNNEITKLAQDEAEAILKDATAEATRLKARSIDYVSELLSKTQEDLKKLIDTIDSNKTELKEKKKTLLPAKQVGNKQGK